MEDPWGSPWAVADAASPPKIDLPAAPPSVHFPIESNNTTTAVAAGAGSSANSPRRGPPSPWGDENDNDLAWGGWGDAAAAGAGANSPAWGTSPGLKPLAPSLSSRGASPDPWRLSGDNRRRSSSVNKRSLALGDGDRIEDSGISLGPSQATSSGRLGRMPSSESGFDAQSSWAHTNPASASAPEAASPLPLLVTTSADEQEPIPFKSAPRIEIGIEAGGPKTVDMTHPLSKVQELVDHYDGIAKQSASPISPSSNGMLPFTKVSNGENVAEEVSTTVDLEDSTEARDVPILHKEIATSVSEHGDAEVWDNGTTRTAQFEESLESHIGHVPSKQEPKPPLIEVTIDLSKLDDLFPSTPEVNTEPELVPDVIIDDSFTSIAERKAWYRLSRKGSKLMHSNDLESYVSMNWNRSTIRQDTLKTVRRWMEEDSMIGRPTMGRKTGVIGPNVFNWNSSAPAVEIGELLGKKKEHSQQASSGSKGSLASPAVASFDWSSPPTSPAEAIPSPPSLAGRFKTSVSRPTRPQSLVAPSSTMMQAGPDSPYAETNKIPRPTSLIASPPEFIVRPSISETLTQTPASNGTENDEDDDDWGEMITSPNSDIAQAETVHLPDHRDRRESTEAAWPTDKWVGFEAQGLHGAAAVSTPDIPSSSAHQDVALEHQQVTDLGSLNGLGTMAREWEVAQGTAALAHAAKLGLEPESVTTHALRLSTDQYDQKETISQHSLSAWFDEPLQPARTADLQPTPSARSPPKPGLISPGSPQPVSSHGVSSGSEDMNVDVDVDAEAVSRILRGIPDLSYMLR